MIQMLDIARQYDTGGSVVNALRGVRLDVERGDYIALVGPSGSGKSTLLHIIGCLDRPTSGTYHLDGVHVAQLTTNELADVRNRKIGFVFQGFHLLPRLNALENVALPLRIAGLGAAGRRERAAMLLGRVGLAARVKHRPSQLSGGEQQRVAIARALANGPAIILADEPTGNLDSQSGAEIIRLLEDLLDEGRTVIMVTHDEAIASRAGRTVRLLDGRMVR